MNRSLLVDGVGRHGQLPDDLQLLPELVPLDRLQHLLRLLVLLVDSPEQSLDLMETVTIVITSVSVNYDCKQFPTLIILKPTVNLPKAERAEESKTISIELLQHWK